MKNNDEFRNSVYARYDEYKKKKAERRSRLLKYGGMSLSVLIIGAALTFPVTRTLMKNISTEYPNEGVSTPAIEHTSSQPNMGSNPEGGNPGGEDINVEPSASGTEPMQTYTTPVPSTVVTSRTYPSYSSTEIYATEDPDFTSGPDIIHASEHVINYAAPSVNAYINVHGEDVTYWSEIIESQEQLEYVIGKAKSYETAYYDVAEAGWKQYEPSFEYAFAICGELKGFWCTGIDSVEGTIRAKHTYVFEKSDEMHVCIIRFNGNQTVELTIELIDKLSVSDGGVRG